MSHLEIQQMLGAYALDAVEPDQRALVEQHLKSCASCRAEVEQAREAAASLVADSSPPAGVWERIAAALEETPPDLDVPRLAGIGRRSVSLRLAAVSAAAAILLIGLLALKVIQQDRRLDEFAGMVHADSLLRTAAAAAVDPRAERVILRSPDELITANLVLLPDGTGYILRHNLKPLTGDRTYQLWALRDDSKISVGVLGDQPDVVAFRVSGLASGFAITVEQAGGVSSTRNNPVVVGFRSL